MDALVFYFILKCIFSGYKVFSNSTFGFSFWTFINVHFQKPPGDFKNEQKKVHCYHNALNFKKCLKKM
jgi:hypothetical protein